MVVTGDLTAATATGDTTETTAGTVTLPSTAKRIIGIYCYAVAGAAITTAEPVTGIFRVTVNSIDVTPGKFALDCVVVLTSGSAAFSPRIYAVNWGPAANAVVEFLVTMDMAQTGALKARGGVIFEK